MREMLKVYVPAILLIALFGGAFGILVLSNLSSQRAANQVFTFVMLPQFFLGGVFNPLTGLPGYLDVLSRIAPLRYAVDLLRGVYESVQPGPVPITVAGTGFNLAVMMGLMLAFVGVGTALFVRAERNR